MLVGLVPKYPACVLPLILGVPATLAGLGPKSKLEAPGRGGVGGRPFRGLPAVDSLSGLVDCDSAEIFRCRLKVGDVEAVIKTLEHN